MLNSTEKSILNLGQEASWSIHRFRGCQSRSGRVKTLGQGKMASACLCQSICFRIMALSLNIWGRVLMKPMMPKLQDPSLCPDLERDPKYVFSCSQVFIKLVKQGTLMTMTITLITQETTVFFHSDLHSIPLPLMLGGPREAVCVVSIWEGEGELGIPWLGFRTLYSVVSVYS